MSVFIVAYLIILPNKFDYLCLQTHNVQLLFLVFIFNSYEINCKCTSDIKLLLLFSSGHLFSRVHQRV